MMDLNYHHLRIFYAVAMAGSFTRASEELYISQPAVSVQVKALEEFFGIPLIDRSGRAIGLTNAGEVVFDHAQRLFNTADAMVKAVEELKGLKAGQLAIASSTTPGDYLLPALIGRFKGLYPGVEVALEITNTPGVLRRLLQNEIDLGFVGDPLDHRELDLLRFRRDEIVVFARPDHPLVGPDVAPAASLRDKVFVLREAGSATRKWAEEGLRELGVSYKVAMELGSNEAVKRAVAAGLGLGMLSRYALDIEVASDALSVVNIQGLQSQRWLYLAYNRRAHLTRAQQAFIQLALEDAP